ncbi:hypothetical protein IWQ57_006694, partial [Coemansia nantahalensis]
MPRSVPEIRRMCGGISAIGAHLPWAQAALRPFNQAISDCSAEDAAGDSGGGTRRKVRLSKAQIQALEPHWRTLKEALMDVRHLHVPAPGAPLTLRVDAASSGIGAVLLAQRSKDVEDVAPVAFYCQTNIRPRKLRKARARQRQVAHVVGAMTLMHGALSDVHDDESDDAGSDAGVDDEVHEGGAASGASEEQEDPWRDYVDERDRLALQGLPAAAEYGDCQQEDDTLLEWRRL